MVWRPEVLYGAFSRVGLLQAGVHDPHGVPTPFECRLNSPDALALSDQHQVTDWEIEYETATIPPVRRGAQLQVTDAAGTVRLFRAADHARLIGDGRYSVVNLELA